MPHTAPKSVMRQVQRMLFHSAPGVTDGALLERYVEQRDEAAFELLVWRHKRMVFSVCRRLLSNHADAEDAYQAVFLVLARKAGSIRHKGSIAGWLYRVAFRAAQRLRATIRKRAATETRDEKHSVDAVDTHSGSPAQIALDRETVELLHEEIERLPEKYRTPVVLCYLEGRTCSEAAEELGEPRGTIATRMAHGRKVLRSRLTKRGGAVSVSVFAALAAERSTVSASPVIVARLAHAATSAFGDTSVAASFSAQVTILLL